MRWSRIWRSWSEALNRGGLFRFCQSSDGGHKKGRRASSILLTLGLFLLLALLATPAAAQTSESIPTTESSAELVRPSNPGQASGPVTITLQDALKRARVNNPQFLSAQYDAKAAREDSVQARAALLPSTSFLTQELLTKGNGVLPSGRYVTNDGVHVYRAWGVFHQDFSPNTLMGTGYRRALAAEALARARAEIAGRGLNVTVTKDYYALLVSQRKYASAQMSLEQAKRFLEISQELERGGEVAHSDVIKAQIQFNQQKQAFEEASLAMESDRLTLAVLLFPTFTENFTLVDDLDSAQSLPPFEEVKLMAARENPDLRAAMEVLKGANLGVSAARASFLPSVVVDVDYGIEANAYSFKSTVSADPKAGRLPNLGHFVTLSFSLPVWDWGALRSKLHQAQYRREQARADLSQTQREMIGNLYSFYNTAAVARSAVDTLRNSAELAAESQRLATLRYRAGQATVLEVVDAQNTLTQARNAYDDGLARYRVALATLQTLTGNF